MFVCCVTLVAALGGQLYRFAHLSDDRRPPWLIEKFNHAFPFGLYDVFSVILATVVWIKLPETKGKTLKQIEQSWQNPPGQ